MRDGDPIMGDRGLSDAEWNAINLGYNVRNALEESSGIAKDFLRFGIMGDMDAILGPEGGGRAASSDWAVAQQRLTPKPA